MSGEPAEVTFLDRPSRCSQCGTELAPGAAACPSCEVQVIATVDASDVHFSRSFGLGELMFVVGAAAVCLAVARLAPGLGIFLAVVATLALVRTIGGIARARAVGWPMDAREKITVFAISLFVAATILAAAGTAFVITCLPIGVVGSVAGVPGMVVAFGCGLLAAVLVTRAVARAIWPIRDRYTR